MADANVLMLAKRLGEMAALLELDGANSFKVAAHEKGSRAVAEFEGDLRALAAEGRLTEIDGVGKGLAEKIDEYLRTGAIAELDELRLRVPATLVELSKINGFGPKKIRSVWQELGVTTLDGLEEAAKDGRLAELRGFGKKTVENLLLSIAQLRANHGRVRLDRAWAAANPVLRYLRGLKAVSRAEVAGSLRRWRETVKDLDFVAETEDPAAVMLAFVNYPDRQRVLGHGEAKSSIVLESGLQADLRCVPPAQFPYALHHFTGSKEHNTAMRRLAKDRGLRMNEYGLHPEDGSAPLPAADEAAVFAHLGLRFVPPELREDRGEIEHAAAADFPRLLERGDVRGMLHMHTNWSDGAPKLEDYATWARAAGVEWMGITDHSQTAFYAGGLKPDRVAAQHAEIDRINGEGRGVRLLKGIESDILADGRLDYDEETLARFDFIVGSIHQHFQLSPEEQTARLVAAAANPFLTVVGHMTGRLLLKRDGIKCDEREVIRACAREGVAIEINGDPHRLELDWTLVKFALDEGVWIAVTADAHTVAGLENVNFAIAQGRKGWLTRERCLNCLSAEGFLSFARARRAARAGA
ncbi:MAG: DNA polymerase/3'-5' exonuclease PolX [Candidatus Sumerlaeia bacterium]|nr:DNA polymerase/3'-5' exonuclease PolX [Candidatus Sumerlaeia bacterium]